MNLEKSRENVKHLFLNTENPENNEILNSRINSHEFITYLKSILQNKVEKEYIIEATNIRNNTIFQDKLNYLKFYPSKEKIEILIEPNKKNPPIEVYYSDIEKIILEF